MSCACCYKITLLECPAAITINGGLAANTEYWYSVTDKFGSIYTKSATTNGSGVLAIPATDFPIGYFMSFSGTFTLKVYSEQAHIEIPDSEVILSLCGLDYSCVIIDFTPDETFSTEIPDCEQIQAPIVEEEICVARPDTFCQAVKECIGIKANGSVNKYLNEQGQWIIVSAGSIDSVNGQTGIVVLDKNDIGLSNVDNTSDADKPVSNATQNALNLKQDALGYTPENSANKTDTMAGNTASSSKYLSAKGVYEWVISLGYITISALSGYATQAWVNSQGFITNVITALGYTPANKAGETFTGAISATNLSGTNTGDNATNSQYSGLASSKEDTANKSTSTGDIASSVKFPVWSAVVSYVTGLGYLLASTAASTYQAILTATNFGSFINGLTAKATPVDADCFVYMDSEDSNKAKKLSWANLKNHVSSYIGFKDVHYIDSIVTGTTSQTIVDTVLIPVNTVTVGKVILWLPRLRKTGTAGTVTVRGYLNTTPTIGGSNFYAPSPYGATTIKITANKFGLVKSATNTEFFSNTAEDLTVISGTNVVSSFNIDWTVDQYLVVTIQLANSADTGTYSGHLLEIK